MFRTLDDLKGKNDKDKKDDKKNSKKQTESYIGGEKSGLAVENPDDIHGVLQKAEENSRKMKDEMTRDQPKDKPEHNCKITLYRNGFTIDDGQFRDYNDPANKKFMAELNKGVVPEELRAKYPKGLKVGLADHRKEEYELPPPPKYVAFSGAGTSLGGTTNTPMEVPESIIDTKAQPPKIDHNKPKTKILIRLYNGKNEEVEVNLNTKVSELFTYVWQLTSNAGEFELIAGFPPKSLTNVNQTIEEAGLEDSKVIQKLL